MSHWTTLGVAASILCALGIIVLASWRMLENEHARHVREGSAFAAAEVEARLRSKFDALLMALMDLGGEVRDGEIDPLDHALEHFAGAARHARGIADIAWVKRSGAARSIALDVAVSPGDVGQVLRHPAATEALRSAAEAGAPRVSAPIVLGDGGPAIVTVLPFAGGEGSLALVLQAAPFIEDVLRDGLRRSFDVCVHDGAVPLYTGGQGPCTLSWIGAGEVRLADRVWHIAVAPPPARAAASVPDLENKMSAVGMAALALLAAFLWLLLSRRSALRESEQRVSDIAANFPGDIYRRVLHPDGTISYSYASAGGSGIYGRAPQSVVADSQVFLDTIHPDDRAGWLEAVRLSAARLARFDHVYRIVRSPGETRWAHSIAQPRRSQNGDVVWDGVMVDITAHHNAEEALKESEQRLASIADNIPGLVFRRVLHADGRISYPYESKGVETLFGLTAEQLAEDASSAIDGIHPDDRAGWCEAMHRSAQSLERFDHEFRIRTPQDELRWVCSMAQPHRLENGDVAWDGVLIDITRQKAAETALREAERRVSDIAANFPGDIYRRVLHTDGSISYPYTSPGGRGVHGRAPESFAAESQSFIDMIHPDDRAGWHEAVRLSAARLERFDHQYRIVPSPGETRWVHSIAQPRRAENGDVVWDGVMIDVTEQRRAEAAHREREAQLRAFFEHSPIEMVLKDAGGRYVLVNRTFERNFETTSDEIRGKTARDVFPAPLAERLIEEDRKALETGQPSERELVATIRGEARTLSVTKFPIVDAEGGAIGVGSMTIDVTEQRHAEDALRESEARLRAYFEHSPVAMALKDSDGRYVLVTPPYDRDFNVTGGDVRGRTLEETLSREAAAMAAESDGAVLASGRPLQRESMLQVRGAPRQFSVTKFPIRDASDHVSGIGSILIDVTEQRQAEQALRDNERRYRTLYHDTPAMLHSIDRDGRIVRASDYWLKAMGYAREEVLGRRIHEFMTEDSRRFCLEIGLPRFYAEGACHDLPYRLVRKDGQTIDVSLSAVAINDDAGVFLHSHSVMVDITDRKRAEDALRESEQRLNDIANNIPGNVFRRILHADGRITYPYLSAQARAFYNVDPARTPENAELVKRAIHPDDLPSWRESLETSVKTLAPFDDEVRVIGSTGEIRWVRSVARPRRMENGDTVWDGVALDITDRKLVELALRESEDRFTAMANAAPVMLWITDPSGRQVFYNEQFAAYRGERVSAGLSVWESDVHPEDRDRVIAVYYGAHAEARGYRMEYRLRRADGVHRWILSTTVPSFAADGSFTGLIGSSIDITERKEAERAVEEAKQAAELANRTKSEFLAHMSHELRTPLNAVIGFSEIMRDELFGPLGSQHYTDYARDIHESGTHLLSLINDILDLSKVEAGKYDLNESSLDLNDLVVRCLRLVKERAESKNIDMTIVLPDSPLTLLADERATKQMLLNLLSNAVKFTPQDGRIEIHGGIAPDGWLELVVEDTGIGIAKEDLAKVREPFGQSDSSRAREYEGTGLGLPLTEKLIRLHGGSLEIESEPGRGTRVSLRFPPDRIGVGIETTRGATNVA